LILTANRDEHLAGERLQLVTQALHLIQLHDVINGTDHPQHKQVHPT